MSPFLSARATRALPQWLTPARLDRFEQVGIVVLYGLLAWRVFQSGNPFAPLILVGETTVVLFVLIRRSTEAISLRLGDWLLAATATCAPLLILPSATPWPVILPAAIALLVFGCSIQIAGKLFLRRSFGIAPANRGIKRGGIYSVVRHPIYAGYLLTHIGVLMLSPSTINLVIYTIGWLAQILRLLAEEKLLAEDPDYRDYMRHTRWRLIPGLF